MGKESNFCIFLFLSLYCLSKFLWECTVIMKSAWSTELCSLTGVAFHRNTFSFVIWATFHELAIRMKCVYFGTIEIPMLHVLHIHWNLGSPVGINECLPFIGSIVVFLSETICNEILKSNCSDGVRIP